MRFYDNGLMDSIVSTERIVCATQYCKEKMHVENEQRAN